MPDINDILGINNPPDQPNSKRKIVEDLLTNLVFSLGQGYQAQAGARGSQARSAGIGAAIQGPMMLQQIRQQQQNDAQDRAIKIQQARELMRRGRNEDALALVKSLSGTPTAITSLPGAPTEPVVNGTPETGLTVNSAAFGEPTYAQIPSQQYELSNGQKVPLPIMNAQQALQQAGIAQRQDLEIKREFAPPAPLKNIDPNSPAGIAARLAFEKGREALKPPPPSVAPPTIRTKDGIKQWNPVTKAFDIKAGDLPPTAAQTQSPPPPGDWSKQGKEFLETIPGEWRKTVEKVANYDEDPSKVAGMRQGERTQLMKWVNQVNPSYDTTLYGNRAPTRKAFTTGTQGQQINAINTAIGHIDQITTLAPQLNNSSFVAGNAINNRLKTAFGEDAATNFDTLKDALAGEVASVLSKGGATVSGISEAKEKIKNSSSPQQLAGYVKTLLPIMGSKLNALDYQYHQAMGENDPFTALSPEAKSILRKNGINPDEPLGAAGGQRMEQFSPSTKQYRYTTDGGKTWASGKLPPIG